MLLGWLPIIGPIIDGVTSIWTKKLDVGLEKEKLSTGERIEAMKASQNVLETFKDDIGIRLARDIVVYPVAIWTAAIGWDSLIVKNWSHLMINPVSYPPSVEFLPYAVLTFLLGNQALNIWRRK